MRTSELKTRWLNYEWNKVCYGTFRERCRKMTREEAIRPVDNRWGHKTTLYPELKARWLEQPEPKCKYALFISRCVHWGRTKEEAIQLKLKHRKWWTYIHTYNYNSFWINSNRKSKPHYIEQQKRYNPEHYKIDITYKPEEAKEFRDAYLRMINKLEIEYLNEEDTKRGIEIQKSIKSLQWELALFNKFNPIK